MSRATSEISGGGKRRLCVAAISTAGIVSSLFILRPAVAGERQAKASPPACIAIVIPGVQGIEGNAADLGSTVRDLFASYLTGPSVQVIQLQARLASLAMEEAKQHNCAHVLTATVTRRRGGGTLGKVMGQAAGSASWAIPYGGTTTSAIARGAAVGLAQAVSSLASTTRAKDELQLEYRVSSPGGGAAVGPRTEKLKAKVDGEDLLTPLVQTASESIVAAIMK